MALVFGVDVVKAGLAQQLLRTVAQQVDDPLVGEGELSVHGMSGHELLKYEDFLIRNYVGTNALGHFTEVNVRI